MADGADDGTSVCVVTHPLSHASETAVGGLLEVVSAAVSSVSLVTANLPKDSDVWDEYEVREVSDADTGSSVLVAAPRFVLNQLRMCNKIRKRDEEIMLFFGATSYLLPILFARLLGKKVVLEPRGNVPDSLRRIWSESLPDPLAYLLSRPVWLLERAGYTVADAVLVLSPSMADDLGLRKPRYEKKLYEHGARPVDIDRFHPIVPYDERDRRIGYLGRLDEEKGVDVLTEVVKHLPEDITFVFIGDGALRPRIEDELSEKIERGAVELTGWVEHDEVPDCLNSIRLLVMTSRTEGVPTTALESMACGTPVCSTPVGGVPDVVKEGETGFLLDDEASPEKTAERVEDAVENTDLAEMSANARDFVVENYSFDAVVEEYRRVFEGVVGNRGSD
jgi:glycosyltransferase involved in cell wall biosynthesis